METQFNKLVRDRIPDIIRAQGQEPVTRILTEEEYLLCLERKLDEETQEFHQSRQLEELADILEVVCALAQALGHSPEELLRVYRQKHEARGGFEKRILLISKRDGQEAAT